MTLTYEQAPPTSTLDRQMPQEVYGETDPWLAYHELGSANGYWRYDHNAVPVELRGWHDAETGIAHKYDTPSTPQETPMADNTFIPVAPVEEVGPDTEKFNAFWYAETQYPENTPIAAMTAPDIPPEQRTHPTRGRHKRRAQPSLKAELKKSLYQAAGLSIGLMLVPLCVQFLRR